MLPYSENDICMMYRRGKDKKLQIQILADMNLTDKGTIRAILIKHGHTVEKAKPPKQKRRALTPEELQKRLEQYRYYSERGYTAYQTAKAMGMSNHYWVRQQAKHYGIEFAKEKKKAAR